MSTKEHSSFKTKKVYIYICYIYMCNKKEKKRKNGYKQGVLSKPYLPTLGK